MSDFELINSNNSELSDSDNDSLLEVIELENRNKIIYIENKIQNLQNEINFLRKKIIILETPFCDKIEQFWNKCSDYVINCFK